MIFYRYFRYFSCWNSFLLLYWSLLSHALWRFAWKILAFPCNDLDFPICRLASCVALVLCYTTHSYLENWIYQMCAIYMNSIPILWHSDYFYDFKHFQEQFVLTVTLYVKSASSFPSSQFSSLQSTLLPLHPLPTNLVILLLLTWLESLYANLFLLFS